MEEELECNTVIGLGLGGDYFTTEWKRKTNNKPPVQLSLLFPSWNIKGEYEEPMRSRIMQEEIRDEGFKEEFSVDEGGGKRKKLRLTTDQSTVLEESFRVHNTLNQNKKLELAERLNLRPRQVEVWFQNRRARTKLKKTEVDCEYLKKCCNRLSNENRRLKKELQDLKALAKSGSSSNAPLSNIQLSMANTTRRMCPSCESITTGDNENN